MSSDEFNLFPFQEEAAAELRAAALDWVRESAASGVPKYGPTPIPFLGQLKAVTGAGKTPVLAEVIGGLGHAVVVWTSRSSAVVEQTFNNLRGKYRSLLPPKHVRILREIPSQAEWQDLISSRTGLTIWVMTTASWNEAEAAKSKGDVKARLSLHRPQQDWSGSESPWSLLRDKLARPLWVVSDESHNQTGTQLDQLGALRPVGFFMASATPVQSELFEKWRDATSMDPQWRKLTEAGVVSVRTRDVVASELLKTTIELYDFRSGTEENIDGVVAALRDLDEAAGSEAAGVQPKAIYIVESSNPPKGSSEQSRPVTIWTYLRSKGIPAREIAIYTDTRELPPDAEKISSLSKLEPRHRHIIFNQALQEGWDDPEAYVAYFDGVTKSFTRIRQIVGRILRQPRAQHFSTERLNTATVFINTPSDHFDKVLTDLQRELRLYAPEDEPTQVPIRVRTRNNPLEPIAAKKGTEKLALPRWSLRAPKMTAQLSKLRSRGGSPWQQEFLDAEGIGRLSELSLEREDVVRNERLSVLRSARTHNGTYLRRRMLARNRACLNAIHPDAISGPAYDQLSCQGSVAQEELDGLAREVVVHFEDRVTYQSDPDPERATWSPRPYQPRNSDLIEFHRAAHPHYSSADFNADELEFARALDGVPDGLWMRNPTSGDGYAIPLPTKVGDSLRFFPDFLWSIDDCLWAIDTTGKHLLSEKVRGKLLTLKEPRIGFVVRGQVDLKTGATTARTGWTAVKAREGLAPLVEHSDDLARLLCVFRGDG